MNKTDKQFWENYFKVYDKLNKFIPYQDLIKDVVAAVDPQPGDVILDAGCGTGNVSLAMKKTGVFVVGLDSVSEALSVYRNKVPESEVVEADLIANLPFENDTFNKCVLNNVIYSIDSSEVQTVIQNLIRIMKSGSIFVVTHPKVQFSAVTLYLEGIKASIQKKGILETVRIVIELLLPTFKILIFNKKIENTKIQESVNGLQLEQMFNNCNITTVNKRQVYCGQSELFVFRNDN